MAPILRATMLLQLIFAIVGVLAGWGGAELFDGAKERAEMRAEMRTKNAKDAEQDEQLKLLGAALQKLSIAAERQNTIIETYGEALRGFTDELREQRKVRR